MTLVFTISISNIFTAILFQFYSLYWGLSWGRKVWFLYILQWECYVWNMANVLKLCYIELLSGDGLFPFILFAILQLAIVFVLTCTFRAFCRKTV